MWQEDANLHGLLGWKGLSLCWLARLSVGIVQYVSEYVFRNAWALDWTEDTIWLRVTERRAMMLDPTVHAIQELLAVHLVKTSHKCEEAVETILSDAYSTKPPPKNFHWLSMGALY